MTRWGTDWSWSKMIDVLSKPGETLQERLSVTRDLLALQEYGVRKLREAIENPSQPEVSWESPFLEVYMEFPYEWDTEVPLSHVDATDSQRNLVISLSILTAGMAVQPADGGVSPLLPLHLRDVVRRFTEEERRTCLKAWFDESSFSPHSFGDNHLQDSDDRTLRRIGPRGADFAAALNFFISPRLVDHKQKKSGFILVIGVPWEAEEAASPRNWSHGERTAFWKAISRFLLTLRKHVENPDSAPSKIVEPVKSRGTTKGILQFVASVKNSRGVSYFEKACVPRISDTGLTRLPLYALGGHGPVLDITDDEGHLQNLAALAVLSVMFYPDDKVRRKKLLAGMHLRILENASRDVLETIPSPELRAQLWPEILAAAPRLGLLHVGLSQVLGSVPSNEETANLLATKIPAGVLVGELLLFIVTCHALGKPLGVTQAVPIFVDGLSKGKADPGQHRFRERSAILREWSRYKPVAHFWAAYVLLRDEDELFAAKPDFELNFLAFAEELRRRGESCFARAQKRERGPVLDPTSTWRPPADLELPAIDLSFPPLSDWVLEHLDNPPRPAHRHKATSGTIRSGA